MRLSALSPWTRPKADLAHQAQIWHARVYAEWLLSAGAEPRLGALLSSGELAEGRWAQLLSEQGVQLERCQITQARPLPAPLTQHRGDHFNRKLFVLEGLDELAPEALEEVITTLNGQRGPLKQSATWVTLLFRSARSLSAFVRLAPHAWSLVERRCLMWESSERAPRAEAQRSVEPLPSWAQPLEQLYWAIDQPERPFDQLTFDRCVRAGVQRPPQGAHERWLRWDALWRGELDFNARRRSSGAGVVETLGETSSHEVRAALTHRAEGLSAGVRVQLEARLEPYDAWALNAELKAEEAASVGELEPLLSPWSALRAQLEAEGAAPSLTELKGLEAQRTQRHGALAELPTALALTGLWLAEGYAALGEVDSCLRVLASLESEARCPLEHRFFAGERLVTLYTLLQRRAEAQTQLKRLFEWAKALGAPLYEVRAIKAKAQHLGALDPSRGGREEQRASRLALLHGVSAEG